MDTAITINGILEILCLIVSVVGLFKALEWIVDKITKQHDKVKKIDNNTEDFEQYKAENDKKIKKIVEDLELANKCIDKAHLNAQKSLDEIRQEILDRSAEDKKEIIQKIADDREEYLKGIEEVKQSITEISSLYQQTTAIVEIKIDNLEKSNTKHLEQLKEAQNKHNNLMERTFLCEKQISLLDNREKVTEHRIDDLEKAKA